MIEVVKTKDLPEVIEERKKYKEAKKGREVIRDIKSAWNGKTFSDLKEKEKDELLKVLAISAGIIKG